MEAVATAGGWLAARATAHLDFLATRHGWPELRILVVNWAVQFVCSWVAFSIYVVWDYRNWKAGRLESSKLPSRHPLHPFWWSQLRMVPLVLYNQLVVWPLVNLLLCWPQWAVTERPLSYWGWSIIPGS